MTAYQKAGRPNLPVRVSSDRVYVVHDWDSLGCPPEAALGGAVAAGFQQRRRPAGLTMGSTRNWLSAEAFYQTGEQKKPGELRSQPSIFIPLGKVWVPLSENVSKLIIEYASTDLQQQGAHLETIPKRGLRRLWEIFHSTVRKIVAIYP